MVRLPDATAVVQFSHRPTSACGRQCLSAEYRSIEEDSAGFSSTEFPFNNPAIASIHFDFRSIGRAPTAETADNFADGKIKCFLLLLLFLFIEKCPAVHKQIDSQIEAHAVEDSVTGLCTVICPHHFDNNNLWIDLLCDAALRPLSARPSIQRTIAEAKSWRFHFENNLFPGHSRLGCSLPH